MDFNSIINEFQIFFFIRIALVCKAYLVKFVISSASLFFFSHFLLIFGKIQKPSGGAWNNTKYHKKFSKISNFPLRTNDTQHSLKFSAPPSPLLPPHRLSLLHITLLDNIMAIICTIEGLDSQYY